MVYKLYKPSFWRYLKGNFLYRVNKRYTKTPHLLYPQFLDDDNPAERSLGLLFGNVLMSKCAEVWVFGSYISPGMGAEIERAKRKKYIIRYFSDDCKEVSE